MQNEVELSQKVIDWITANGMTFAKNALCALALLLVGWLAIRIVTKIARAALTRGGKAKLLLANFIVSVVNKTLWAVLAIMILGQLGVNVGPLVAGLGVTGFIVGFAFQESLGNLASGMMIALNDPFKIGDFVSAGGLEGTVQEVNMMATVLSTGDNKRITLPNKSVWGGPIVNYSALGQRRVDLQVGIAYGADIAKALAVIEKAVKGVDKVLATPAPTIAVAALDNSAVTINVRPWTTCADYWGVYSATLKAVKEALDAAKIEIPFPQMVVHNA